MSWQHQQVQSRTASLQPPKDGVVACTHPPGWLGSRFKAVFKKLPSETSSRVLRGRNFARRGRLRGLIISPGLASADLVAEEVNRPTLRVRTFDQREWGLVLDVLLEDLNNIASLLEGDMPETLMKTLEDRGVSLLPTLDEIDCDCDCGDYIMPCAHASAVFHVLSDAVDGDPFLLITLRGRPREHLLSTLRVHWGDDEPMEVVSVDHEESVPDGDWFSAPATLPEFGCTYEEAPNAAAGLRALGPPPGDTDLLATLTPLYEAGGHATRSTIESIPEREAPRRPAAEQGAGRSRDPETTPPAARTEEATMATAKGKGSDTANAPRRSLTEELVDILARQESASSKSLAEQLDVPLIDVRNELLELEKLGLVYRTGQTRGTRWWLG